MKKQRAFQLVEAAVWLEATGDLAGARKLYEQALKMDPENARAKQALERDEARPPPRMTPPRPMPAVVRATPAPPPPPPPEPKMTPAPPPLSAEPKRTLTPYQSLHDTLPPIDPEMEEQATVVDMSLQHHASPDDRVSPDHPTLPGFARPDIDLGPKRAPPPLPDDPEPKTPPRPPPPPLPPDPPDPQRAPASERRYLEVNWSALRTPDPSSAPTPPWIPKEALTGELDRTPPPSRVPPNMNPRKRPAPPPADPTPPPRNAWEEDGTMPGVDLSPVLTPPRTRDAMDLLSDLPPRATPPPMKKPENVRQEVESLIKGARDLLELDDHTGAMDLIEKAAQLAPDDPMVQRLKANSEVVLQSMYESKLGRLDARPRLLLRPDEIIWLNLDHRAGFVLAQIDGSVTFEDLVAICGMSRLDTLRILAQLVGAGVIAPSYGG